MWSLRQVVSELGTLTREGMEDLRRLGRVRLYLAVPPFGKIPLWYGRAFLCWDRDVAIYYPVPLNWIVKWARDLFFVIKFGPHPNRWETALHGAYKAGERAGFDHAVGRVEEILASWERDLIERGQGSLIVGPR